MAKRIAYVAQADRAAAGQAISATALCESQRHGLCPGKIVSAIPAHGQRCQCACHRREEVAA